MKKLIRENYIYNLLISFFTFFVIVVSGTFFVLFVLSFFVIGFVTNYAIYALISLVLYVLFNKLYNKINY